MLRSCVVDFYLSVPNVVQGALLEYKRSLSFMTQILSLSQSFDRPVIRPGQLDSVTVQAITDGNVPYLERVGAAW